MASCSLGPATAGLLERSLLALEERAPASSLALGSLPPRERDAAHRVLACSDFVARSLLSRDGLLPELIADGSLKASRSLDDYRRQVEEVAIAAAGEEAPFMAGLRRLRQKEMVRIAWRDLAGDATTEQTLLEASWFAEAAIAGAT
ncbi:MAG: hypothetical protein RLZZ393_1536, partial [Pseudomonadota bacterium]